MKATGILSQDDYIHLQQAYIVYDEHVNVTVNLFTHYSYRNAWWICRIWYIRDIAESDIPG
jgi:hypothetical protein